MESRTSLAMSGPLTVLLQGRKWAILVRQSTTTRTASLSWLSGKSVMKSREIKYHGLSGTGRGLSSSNGWCLGALARA